MPRKPFRDVHFWHALYNHFGNGAVFATKIAPIYTLKDGQLLYYESFDYDKNGNKVYVDKNGEITRYKYDGMNRLTRAWNDNTYTEYEFDNYNNISKEYELYGNSIETKSYYYDNANHLLLQEGKETTQYEYDNAGNLVKKITGIGSNAETAYYSYDGYNRLSEYVDEDTVSEYAYNLDGLRESKTVNNIKTRYVYDGANILGEITEENIYTYYRGTELIGYTSNSGDRLYYVQDGHGNVTALLNEDGTERKTYNYNPYGKEEEQILYPMGSKTAIMLWRLQVETPHNPFRFCGEYYDDETDLIYLRNRYYDNQTGRFITEDPIKDGLNWYSYCGNNPINYIDPTGLYDRDEAVKYAVKWYDGTNSPTYERFDTVGAFISSFGRTRGDCANFVSQSLVAGGLTMNSSWHYYSKTTDEWHGNSVIEKIERDMTSAWASAKGQYQFFSSDWAGYKNGEVIQIWSKEGMEYNIKYNNIQKGDLMFFAHKKTGEVYHSTIISRVTEDEIEYAAHTSNRDYEPLSEHLQNDFVVIVRIRDEAVRGYTE